MIQFQDSRTTLPRGPGKWGKRRVENILGIVVHHTAGGGDVVATARYHSGPNHVDIDGMPGIGYTFFIDAQAVVHLCNDLDDATWSQGGHGAQDLDGDGKVDGHPNKNYLSICVGGNFDSPLNPTGEQPTGDQIVAFVALVGHLTGHAPSSVFPAHLLGALAHVGLAVWGHDAFGKAACPGSILSAICRAMRNANASPRSTKLWQLALDTEGFSPGPADGKWGPRSKGALVAFQRARGLPVTGVRDRMTEDALFGK